MGYMTRLKKMKQAQMLLRIWLDMVRFWGSIPYFSNKMRASKKKLPAVSAMMKMIAWNTTIPTWSLLWFSNVWLASMMLLFKTALVAYSCVTRHAKRKEILRNWTHRAIEDFISSSNDTNGCQPKILFLPPIAHNKYSDRYRNWLSNISNCIDFFCCM